MKLGADFDALVARFSQHDDQALALAVSGGSDSTALLYLSHEWARRSGRRLHVFTVDHRLRPSAAAESARVARVCAELGHPHATLTWTAPKPTQAAARQARYQLMCAAMREISASILLVAHTFDDVVETAIMRRQRGIRGASTAGPVLAAPAPVWPDGRGVTLVRPLLHASRSCLRDLLTREDWAWVEDPSNTHTEFERVRVRQFLARHPRLAATVRDQVQRLRVERMAADRTIGAALARVDVDPDALITLDESDISPRLITLLARCASGGDRDPRAAAAADMLAGLKTAGARQTLGGAWFQKTDRGLKIGRDPGEARAACCSGLFDGRFEVSQDACLPPQSAQAFLVRSSSPRGTRWRETISDRLAHLSQCLQTPDLSPLAP